MLLSYTRPADISWTLDGTGSAFLTSSERLTNGRPNSPTRIQWLSGSQTTSSVLKLQAQWTPDSPAPDPYSTYQTPVNRFCALIGVTLPVGTKITAGLLYTKETRVIQRSDGVRMAVFYFAPGENVDMDSAMEFSIFNDVYGSASIAADSSFEIGEAWVGPSAEWCIRPTPQFGLDQLSKQKLSLSGQPFRVARRAIATSQFEVTPVIYRHMFGALDVAAHEIRIAQANLGVADLRERLVGYAPAMIVPMAAEPFTGSTPDPDFINRHAQFGYFSTLGPVVGDPPRFVFSGTFNAPPAWLPTGSQ